MTAQAKTSQNDLFAFSSVDTILGILNFLSSIIQIVFWYIIKPIISKIYTWLIDQLRSDYTPYKGDEMVQGKYKCQKCGNRWSSGRSWAFTSQKCKNCLTQVYPHEQRALSAVNPVDDKIDAEVKKPHLPHLCGKCEELGYNCRRDGKIA